jgi:hypothetical protein
MYNLLVPRKHVLLHFYHVKYFLLQDASYPNQLTLLFSVIAFLKENIDIRQDGICHRTGTNCCCLEKLMHLCTNNLISYNNFVSYICLLKINYLCGFCIANTCVHNTLI